MRKIGFHGGSSLCELGPASDVELFFDCLRIYAEQAHSDQDWSLLTDRLYRRYLRFEELDKATALMEQARQIFGHHAAASSVEWDASMRTDSEKSWLNPNQSTLADVFIKYFESFLICVESAKLFKQSWNIYKPVRIVISDLPGFARDKNKPLADYDALEGKPLWLQ